MKAQEARERRITITLSKKQKAFLLDFAKTRGLTPSKLVAWLLYYKTKDFKNTIEMVENPKQAIKRVEVEQKVEEDDPNDWSFLEEFNRRKSAK